MANKKLQNNQNNKKTETPGMTNGTASATSSTTNPSIGVIQNQNHVSNGVVNTAAPVNSAIGSEKISTTSNATSSSVTAPTNTSTTSFSSQRLPTYSNQASFNKEGGGGAQKAKKDTGIMGGGQQNQSGGGGYRSGGNKDHRARDKEKTFRQTQQQQQTQQNHYHSSGQCSGSQNQNSRKKEKFQNSRDHSSQSRRGGPIHNNYTKNVEVTEMVKPIGFPQVPTPPVVAEKLVQTDPFENSIEHKEIAKKSTTKKRGEKVEENAGMLKKSHPKHMDTVLAFKEHDEWNKVELMCELLSFLDPVDLRLVGNCIEGSVRCYTNQMRPVEKTSNCSEPTASLPPFVCAPTNASNGGVPHPNSAAAGLQKHNIMSTFTGPMTQPPPGLPPIPSLGGLPVMMYPTTSDAFSSTPSSSSSNKEISSLPNGMVSPPNTTNSGGTTTPTDEEKNKNCQNGSVPTSTTPAASSPEAETPTAAPTQPEPPVPQDPALFLRSVQDLTSYLYILMSVCDSTNRKSAAKIADYMTNVILREKPQILERIPDPLDKIDVLQHIGKIVAAIVHHPAVSVDVKLKYMNMRDDFRAEIENLFQQYYADQRKIIESRLFEPSERGVGLEEEEGEESDDEMEDGGVRSRLTSTTNYYNPHGSSASAPPTFFITRFIGRQISGNDNLFLVEIHWSDGDQTFTQRTREQLRTLQHRLLDEFGQQRSEKTHIPGMSTSISSFDEDSKKLSTSCSTMDTTYPPSSGERIIPRMHRDATAAQMTQYINELSDLPARMMLSSVICEEFNGTRSRTEDLLQEVREMSDGLIYSRWKNPRSKSPIRFFERNSSGVIEPIELPVNLPPFIYSNVPQGHMQTLYPSCSNCGGPHAIKNCEKPTILDRKLEHKMRLEPESSTSKTSSNSAGMPSSSIPPLTAAPVVSMQAPPNPVFHMESNGNHPNGPPIQMNNTHFQHHQQQQMAMLQNVFHNGAQFRPIAQFEAGPPPVYLMQQQTAPISQQPPTVPSATPTNGGNSSN